MFFWFPTRPQLPYVKSNSAAVWSTFLTFDVVSIVWLVNQPRVGTENNPVFSLETFKAHDYLDLLAR
jgi:hypothetical protein